MPHILRSPQARITLTQYGARLAAIETPDRTGKFGHILLGFDDPAAFATAGGSFGAVLGRVANRIAGGKFTLDGATHQLTRNDNGNTLHGGAAGFGDREWQVESATDTEIIFTRISPSGEEGFPGTLTTRAAYHLQGETLTLSLYAATDAPTIVNLSSHPYFNLTDAGASDILDHEITIEAAHFLPTDSHQIPTGELRPVATTPFDFRTPTPIGRHLREVDPQLLTACGYDHCFVLEGSGLRFAARAFSPRSGRVLELHTTQPGLQFYSGNNLTGALAGRFGVAMRQSSGFALEAQNFPNAPNQPNFPSPILRPGEAYRQTIIYKFTTTA